MSNASGNLNQLSTSSMTPTGPMAYDANTPQIDTPTSTTSSGLKLKIKLPPPPGGTPVSSQGNNSKAPSIAPLRISLGGSSDQNRKRSHKGDGHGGPASKMSRVLGTPLESEHKFLASKGLSHSSKSHKKVTTFQSRIVLRTDRDKTPKLRRYQSFDMCVYFQVK